VEDYDWHFSSDLQADRKYIAVLRSAGKQENWTPSRTTS